MIFTASDEEIVGIWRCGVCKRTYRRSGGIHLNCAVMHEPGSCCHWGETIIEPEQLESILVTLNRPK